MKREELIKLGNKIKDSGFRVFVPEKENYLWLIFTDGKNIFYSEGLDVALKYKPCKEYGACCQVFESIYPNVESKLYDLKTKDMQELCDYIPLGEVNFYKDLDEYMEKSGTKYIEL